MHIQGNVHSGLLSLGQVFFGKMYFLEGAFRGGKYDSKNNAVLERRTGQFGRLVDFEASRRRPSTSKCALENSATGA